MKTNRCHSCLITNRGINDLSGVRHTETGGKPSRCPGPLVADPGQRSGQ
jgi:hypothetical protein